MFERYRDRMQREREYEAAAAGTMASDSLTVYGLICQGFERQEIESLIDVRRRYLSAELNEWPIDDSHFRFARWLYEQGRIGI